MNHQFFTYVLQGILLFSLASCKLSQRTTPMPHTECDSLYFDLDTGMINAVSPRLSQSDIKEWFTCYTGSTPDGSSEHCGGGVFYKNHGFTYYTYLNYVEVSSQFKGKLSKPLMGMRREEVQKVFPVQEPAPSQEEVFNKYDFFTMPYGCLRVEYLDSAVTKVSAHFNLCEYVEICPGQ